MPFKPYLASISVDRFDLRSWRPQNREDVLFPLVIDVGWEGEKGTNLFYASVATPEALRARASEPVLSDRAMILVSDYSYDLLEQHIRSIVHKAQRETYHESCSVLCRYFEWEYEDFVPAEESDEDDDDE